MEEFGKVKDTKELSLRDLKTFEKLCRPIVEHMQKHTEQFTPHSTIIITVDGAKLVSDEMFVPYKLPDGY